MARGYYPKFYPTRFSHGLGLEVYETFKYFESVGKLRKNMTTKPTSEDDTNEDLDSLLAGLKQEQLDKLAQALNKPKKARDLSQRWRENKEKKMLWVKIKGEAERLFKASQKWPHQFDNFKDFRAYDDKLRADTMAQAIEIYKENDE